MITSLCSTTGVTPSQALLGYDATTTAFLSNLQPKKYAVGDLVLVRISSIVTAGDSRKLKPRFKGPFKITEILSHDRYTVRNITGCTYEGKYATEDIKPWVTFSSLE